MDQVKGSCLCGDISFVINGPFDDSTMLTCHCRDCQQITGTGHTRAMIVQGHQVEWTGPGETTGYTLISNWGNNVETHFCGNCGSPIYKYPTAFEGEQLAFNVGTFDDESINIFDPSVQIWMHSKAAWDNVF